MSIIVGYVLAANGTGESSNLTPLRAPAYTDYDGALHTPLVYVGPATDDEWPAPIVREFDGYKTLTSFEDWYYRIHFYPARFDLGNLVGRQQRTLTVWNAFFNAVELESFTLTNGEGIIVTQPVVPPATVLPLKVLKYGVEITTEGPPVIDATATFVFDGDSYDIPFTGRRIVVFPFKPNWSSAVEETLESLTTVETSYSGKEQVSEIRDLPRRLLSYNLRIHNFDVNLFDNVVYGWGGRMFALPLWHEKSKLTLDAFEDNTTLALNTSARSFETGALALLFKDVTEFEIIEVASVSSSEITTARPLQFNWPKGTLVYPIMISALDANVPTSRVVDNHVDAAVRFVCSPAENNPRMAVTAAPATYRGEELYLGETNWIAPLPVEMLTRENRPGGDDTGIFRLIKRAPFPLITRGFRWLAKDRQQAETLRQFFARRRGRLKPVWVPSGTRDFEMIEDATEAQSTIYVKNTDYAALVNLQPARSDIVIILRNGTRLPRKIVAASVDDQGRGSLTLDSALGLDLTPSMIKKISYLGLWRLSSDSITFSWRTDGVAVIESNLTLKEPTA